MVKKGRRLSTPISVSEGKADRPVSRKRGLTALRNEETAALVEAGAINLRPDKHAPSSTRRNRPGRFARALVKQRRWIENGRWACRLAPDAFIEFSELAAPWHNRCNGFPRRLRPVTASKQEFDIVEETMQRYLAGLALGLGLLVGCNQNNPPAGNAGPATNAPNANEPKNKGVHVHAPGVNIDVNKNESGKHADVNVDVKKP